MTSAIPDSCVHVNHNAGLIILEECVHFICVVWVGASLLLRQSQHLSDVN